VLGQRRVQQLRAEAEAARDRFMRTLEHMSDCFLVLDRDWRISYANTAAVQFLHRRLEDLLDKVYWEEFPPVLGTITEREFRRVVTEQMTVKFEVYYTPWERWVEVRAYPVPEGGITVFFLDITARKQAEEALARHTEALHFANQDLRQIAYLSAHDLQEQIRTVTIYTQLLAQEYGPQLDAPMNQYVENVVTAATHLSTLFHDVLTYLALDHDEQKLVTVDGEVLWQQMMAVFQKQIISNKAYVTHDPLPIVQANGESFALVFHQMLDNALKFHRPETPPNVYIWAEWYPDEWRFAVRDQGIGLVPDYAELIFGVGKRLHSRGRYPGTGMGLAICKKIINQHGGRIWVESTLGSGSTFYFTLPTSLSVQKA